MTRLNRGAAAALLPLIFTLLLGLPGGAPAQTGVTASPNGEVAPAGQQERARGPAVPEDARVPSDRQAAPSAEAETSGTTPASPTGPAPDAARAAATAEAAPTNPAPTPEAQAGAGTPDGAALATGAGADVEALIGLLRDETARERLIAELERLATGEAGGTAAGGATATETGPTARHVVGGNTSGAAGGEAAGERDQPFGARIAMVTQEIANEIAGQVNGLLSGLRSTARRLEGFQRLDWGELSTILIDIGIVLAITIGLLAALRAALRTIFARLGAIATGAGIFRKTGIVALSSLLDALTVIVAWGVGYGVALFVLRPVAEIELHQALFLNAFLLVGAVKVVLRTVLAPTPGRVRLAPMSDASALYWARWTSFLANLLGYGLMLVVPIVNETVNFFTGRATAVVIEVVFVIVAMVLVIRHRKDPSRYYGERASEEGGDVTLNAIAFVARFWHVAAIAYLWYLLAASLSQSGNLQPTLITTGKIVAAVAVAAFIMELMGRASDRGVRFPGRVNERLPLLERRVNAFVPAFLRIVRFVVMLLVVSFALQVTGIADLDRWIRTSFGVDFAGTLVSVSLIVLAAFLFWLGMTSWVDYRLTPRRGRRVTSREQTLLTLLRNAVTVVIAVLAFMFSLSEIGIDIAPLLASAGVLGLAIGFGAQRMVQDIITGIFIQFENAINVGDVVTAGGTTGVVEKLTIRSVSLRDLNGVFHIIPFSSVDMVSNFMRGFAYHVADIGIAYREDVDEAKALMLEAFEDLRADPEQKEKVIGDLEWFGVQALGDSAVVLRARIKTRPGDQWGIGRLYNELVKKRFDKAGVEIPFPHMTVWFGEMKEGSAPPAHLALSEKGVAGTLLDRRPGPSGDRTGAKGAGKPTQDEPLDAGGADEGEAECR